MWTRLATDSDLADIALIDAIVEVEADRRAIVLQAIAQRTCWVAGHDDAAQGYLTLLPRHFFGRDFVALVIVHESVRRQGLASALFSVAEASAKTDQLFTSTNQSNLPMQSFLEMRDYMNAGVVSHLDPGDPEIVFVKYLS